MAQYKGAASEAGRAMQLMKKREKEREHLEQLKQKIAEVCNFFYPRLYCCLSVTWYYCELILPSVFSQIYLTITIEKVPDGLTASRVSEGVTVTDNRRMLTCEIKHTSLVLWEP